jgi:hypothetical protein
VPPSFLINDIKTESVFFCVGATLSETIIPVWVLLSIADHSINLVGRAARAEGTAKTVRSG